MELRREMLSGLIAVIVYGAALALISVALQERVFEAMDQREAAVIAELLNVEVADARSPSASSEEGAVAYEEAPSRLARLEGESLVARHAQGGVWVILLLTCVGIFLTNLVWSRARRRVLEPVLAMSALVEAASDGQTPRRLPVRDAPDVIRALNQHLSEALDARSELLGSASTEKISLDWRAVTGILDVLEGPAWIVRAGEIHSANQDAMNWLQGARGRAVRASVAAIAPDEGTLRRRVALDMGDFCDVISLGDGDHLWRADVGTDS